MKAIIPAAGIGKRLRPHTLVVPKVMINMAGRPLIGHVIEAIEKAGVTEVSVIVGYKNDQVERYVTREHGYLNPVFPFQKERRGLGHAVLKGLEDKEESVLVILGDTVFDVDFESWVEKGQNIIGVVRVEDPRRFGVAEVQGDRVVKLVEKPEHPRSNLALAGLYFIRDQRILKAAIEELIEKDIRTRGEYQLTDALQLLVQKGETIRVKEIDGWYDCGTRESLLDSHRFLLNNLHSDPSSNGAIIHPPVYIHPEAIVQNSIVGPYVTLDKGARVTDAVISNSIVGRNAMIQSMILKDSLIGENATTISPARTINIGDYSELKFD